MSEIFLAATAVVAGIATALVIDRFWHGRWVWELDE